MTDNPTTEVLRRAEEQRPILKAAVEKHGREIARLEALISSETAGLREAAMKLAMLEYHVFEPLADQEVAWCATEKAQPSTPWAKPEQHRRARRDLEALVLNAVDRMPGGRDKDFAHEIGRTRISRIKEVLGYHEAAGRIQRRSERWYPVPQTSGMSVLMDPDVPTIWNESDAEDYDAGRGKFAPDASVTLTQDHEECQRDADTLYETRTASSADTPAEISPEPEMVHTAPQERAAAPDPEVTLDFIRRAGPEGLSDFQLRKHVDNLPGLVERGVIECNQNGRTRYVNRDETTEATK